MANRLDGATTVSATMILAAAAGIHLFVTGGAWGLLPIDFGVIRRIPSPTLLECPDLSQQTCHFCDCMRRDWWRPQVRSSSGSASSVSLKTPGLLNPQFGSSMEKLMSQPCSALPAFYLNRLLLSLVSYLICCPQRALPRMLHQDCSLNHSFFLNSHKGGGADHGYFCRPNRTQQNASDSCLRRG